MQAWNHPLKLQLRMGVPQRANGSGSAPQTSIVDGGDWSRGKVRAVYETFTIPKRLPGLRWPPYSTNHPGVVIS